MTGHTVRPTVEQGSINWHIECHEPPGSICRLICLADCETWYQSPDDPTKCSCGSTFGEVACNVVASYNDIDPAECYAGDETPLRAGRIDARWDGEVYEWDYVDDPIAESTARIAQEIADGRHRAHAKHGDTSIEGSGNHFEFLAILTEEVGEAAEALNDHRHDPAYPLAVNLRAELVDVATVAVAWAASIDARAGAAE